MPCRASGGTFGEANIGNPVALSPREAAFDVLAIEVGRGAIEPSRIDILQNVDADHCIEPIRDLARDQRHDTASCADVKRCGPGAELVPGTRGTGRESRRQASLSGSTSTRRQCLTQNEQPHARAGMRGGSPSQSSSSDIPAVTFAGDDHGRVEGDDVVVAHQPLRVRARRVSDSFQSILRIRR